MVELEEQVMRVHYLLHNFFVRPAEVDTWVKKNSHSVTQTLLYENDPFPGLNDFDFLIIFGGTMGVYEGENYSWMKPEKKFVEKVIKNKKAVFGICMGAQLLADVLGGKVYKNSHKEIGWHEVEMKPDAQDSSIFGNLPERFPAVHWHGDLFEVPDSCFSIASSIITPNQAFEYNKITAATQFHPEYNLFSLQESIQYSPEDVGSGPYAQTEQEILSGAHQLPAMHNILFSILDNISKAAKINSLGR
ncbi:type 1 glutamine amidotransferase [candidate division KSB1 bacterium]